MAPHCGAHRAALASDSKRFTFAIMVLPGFKQFARYRQQLRPLKISAGAIQSDVATYKTKDSPPIKWGDSNPAR